MRYHWLISHCELDLITTTCLVTLTSHRLHLNSSEHGGTIRPLQMNGGGSKEHIHGQFDPAIGGPSCLYLFYYIQQFVICLVIHFEIHM